MGNNQQNKSEPLINKEVDILASEIKHREYENFIYFLKYISLFMRKHLRISKIFLLIIISFINFYNFGNNKEIDIKPIALYYPKYYSLSQKDDNSSNIEKINNLINITKVYGIYGFGIYYDPKEDVFNYPLDIIIGNQKLDIRFLIILCINPDNLIHNKTILINKQNNYISNIKTYLTDKRYIKFEGKPAIGIFNPQNIYNLNETLLIWRKKAKEFGIREIFIFASCNDKNIDIMNKMKIFNAFFDLSSYNSTESVKSLKKNYYFYFPLLYKNLELNIKYSKNEYNVYRSSDIVSQYPIQINSTNIYSDYVPEKFYFLNKIIIEFTKDKFKENNRYIFINSFDNNYLENQDKNVNLSLNYLYKALFDLPLEEKNYNILNLQNNSLIAVQAHIFYVDLLNDIVNKTNNIPAKFDLYITTDTEEKKKIIEDYIQKETKATKYEILVVENKGRDVLPLLNQFKTVMNKYKYFCHIHSKKTPKRPMYGDNWRNYLYGNLLGNKDIISEILTDFENSEKLGFVYPETFSGVLRYTIVERKVNKNNLNILLKKIIPRHKKVGNKIDYPAGNMFWARVKAVYQVFEQDINDLCPEEKGQTDGTIMHAVERIWLYIVKYNGYYYKKILKYVY